MMKPLDQTSPEDIKKGLGRLNSALQDLRKAEEAHQQSKQTYEMFYHWLLQRTPFFLDTTTGFYRLGASKTSDNASKQNALSTQEEIDMQIAAMNKAEHDYNQASTPEEQKDADSQFSICWDWLTVNKVPFYLDDKEQAYRYRKKPL